MSADAGIVGYTYKADLWCPSCMLVLMASGPRTLRTLDAEHELDILARRLGIHRDDEATYDSDVFPKVVLGQMCDGDQHCGDCNSILQ